MFDLVALPLSIASGAAVTLWVVRRFPNRMLRPNFQKRQIPNACGLVLVVSSVLYFGGATQTENGQREVVAALYLIAGAGFGVLGLIDDLWGDRSVGGLGGHLRALMRGQVTTGAIKAIGGLVLGLACGWLLHPASWRSVLTAAVVAGMSNSLNLVDLRPGRCLSMFFVGLVPLAPKFAQVALNGSGAATHPLVFALAVAILLFAGERKAMFMLGDTGSNSFGAVLGVAYAIYLPDVRVQLAIAGMIVLFHAWTERHSLSRAIDNSPLLRRLDAKIGVR